MSVRVTQDVSEVLRDANPNVRVTQDIVDVLRNGSPAARVTQDVVEVLRDATPKARVTQVVVEVLRTVGTNPSALTSNVIVTPTVVPSGDRTKSVTSSVSVAQSAVQANLRFASASNSASVSQSAVGTSGHVAVSLTQSVTVTPTVVPRPDNVRLTVSQPVTVTSTIGPSTGDREIHVVQGVSVSQSAAGRNNNVRIGVSTAIHATDGETDHTPDVNVNLTTPATVGQSASAAQNHLYIADLIGVSDSVTPRGSTHQYVVQPIRLALSDQLAARAAVNPARISITDYVTVSATAAVDPLIHFVSVGNSVVVNQSVHSNPQVVYQQCFGGGTTPNVVSTFQTVIAKGDRRLSLTSPVSVTARLGGNLFLQSVTTDIPVITSATTRTPRVEIEVVESVHVTTPFLARAVPVQRITDLVAVSQGTHISDLLYPVESRVSVSQAVTPRNDHQRIVQPITVTLSPFVPPHHVVHVSQAVNFTYSRTLVDTLAPTDTVSRNCTYHRPLLDELPTSDSTSRAVTWSRSLADSMPFQEPYYLKPIDFLDHPVLVPVLKYHLIGSHVANYTLFQSPRGSIVLPAPLMGDTLDNVATVEVKRSMSGKAIFFKQSSNRQSLHMSFRIDHVKALELRSFMITSLSEVITLITWDGRQYVGYFTNNPFELSNDGRAEPALEFSTLDLEFEGTRL